MRRNGSIAVLVAMAFVALAANAADKGTKAPPPLRAPSTSRSTTLRSWR